jgi:hypothetical protein
MKIALAVVAFFLLIGCLLNGSVMQLGDWSTSERSGGNCATIAVLIGGPYLIYRAYKSQSKPDE